MNQPNSRSFQATDRRAASAFWAKVTPRIAVPNGRHQSQRWRVTGYFAETYLMIEGL